MSSTLALAISSTLLQARATDNMIDNSHDLKLGRIKQQFLMTLKNLVSLSYIVHNTV